MKRIFALILAAMMTMSMGACNGTKESESTQPETSQEVSTESKEETPAETPAETPVEEEKPETITIEALNANKEAAEIEVPYDPQRVAILDMPALDILDSLDLGDRVVGCTSVSIEYLTDYNPDDSNGEIINLGTVKTADLEKVAACEPDVIFIGGRLSKTYAELEAIAPVVFLAVDYDKGVVESTKDNAMTIASMFGKEEQVEELFSGFQSRIDALHEVLNGKNVLLSMFNSNTLGLLGTESQLNMISKELGAVNLSDTVGEEVKATHGEEASWETIINLDPEYMFVLDRSTAIGASGEGVMGAKEVIENELVKGMNVYEEGKIVYFMEHANVWYTSTGGVQALDTMLADLEAALL